MKQIYKEYARPFLVEPTKLTRLVDRIHERLAQHRDTTPRDYFEALLSGSRREEMTSVAEVLALENSRKGDDGVTMGSIVYQCIKSEQSMESSDVAEIKCHFNVVAEGLEKKLQLVAERVSALDERVGRVEDRMTSLEEKMERGLAEIKAMIKFS
jgi:hypothetical protein